MLLLQPMVADRDIMDKIRSFSMKSLSKIAAHSWARSLRKVDPRCLRLSRNFAFSVNI